jgi:hypothetical protein
VTGRMAYTRRTRLSWKACGFLDRILSRSAATSRVFSSVLRHSMQEHPSQWRPASACTCSKYAREGAQVPWLSAHCTSILAHSGPAKADTSLPASVTVCLTRHQLTSHGWGRLLSDQVRADLKRNRRNIASDSWWTCSYMSAFEPDPPARMQCQLGSGAPVFEPCARQLTRPSATASSRRYLHADQGTDTYPDACLRIIPVQTGAGSPSRSRSASAFATGSQSSSCIVNISISRTLLKEACSLGPE